MSHIPQRPHNMDCNGHRSFHISLQSVLHNTIITALLIIFCSPKLAKLGKPSSEIALINLATYDLDLDGEGERACQTDQCHLVQKLLSRHTGTQISDRFLYLDH